MSDLTVLALFDVPAAMGLKRCCICKQSKPLDEFGKNRSRPDGLAKQCKPCHRAACAANRERYPEATRERVRDAQARRRQRDGAAINAVEFARRRERRAADPTAARAADRAYYAANAARIIDNARKRRRDNPGHYGPAMRRQTAIRRALKASRTTVPFTLDQLSAKMTYWGDRCYLCRAPWQSIEHVKPLSAGGLNIVANFRPACLSCNSSKGSTWHGPAWAMTLIGSRRSTTALVVP